MYEKFQQQVLHSLTDQVVVLLDRDTITTTIDSTAALMPSFYSRSSYIVFSSLYKCSHSRDIYQLIKFINYFTAGIEYILMFQLTRSVSCYSLEKRLIIVQCSILQQLRYFQSRRQKILSARLKQNPGHKFIILKMIAH